MITKSDFAIRSTKTEKLPPDPRGTAQALQRIGYNLEDALADLIDNSIDAKARNVLIRFLRDPERIRKVAIADDGLGMSEGTLHKAMQYGVQVPHGTKDLGKYGVGLKTASFSQCQTLSVFSKQGRTVNGRRWTLTKMQDEWRCEILDPTASAALFQAHWNQLDLDAGGTIVLWEDLDALGTGTDIDKLVRKINNRLPVELGLRFHRFIASGQLSLWCEIYDFDALDIAPIKVQAYDPFAYAVSGHKGYPIDFDVQLHGRGVLTLNAHIWPPKSAAAGYKLGGGRVAERQGFYFYRNDRLIQGGGWNSIRESDSEPHSSLARVAIDLPPGLDSAFNLTIQKSKVVPPTDFKAAVLSARKGNTSFEDYIAAAVDTYRDLADDEDVEQLIPGEGLPVALQRKISSILSADSKARQIRFEWADLDGGSFFSPDAADAVVYLNSKYRSRLVEKGAHATSDIPLVKVLLFLLLSPDLKKSRSSKKRDEWHALCNEMLIAAVKGL